MAIIFWTAEAENWLKNIHQYIAKDNPSAAIKVVNGIYERVQQLQQFPKSGQIYRDVPEGEIRLLLFGHYRIAYLINKNDNLDILGVFHGALDIEMYFPE